MGGRAVIKVLMDENHQQPIGTVASATVYWQVHACADDSSSHADDSSSHADGSSSHANGSSSHVTLTASLEHMQRGACGCQ